MLGLLILWGILLIICIPLFGFFLGWGLGWILNFIMGAWLIDGLKLIGLIITPEHLPLFFGMIGLIASFFGLFMLKPLKLNKEKNK